MGSLLNAALLAAALLHLLSCHALRPLSSRDHGCNIGPQTVISCFQGPYCTSAFLLRRPSHFSVRSGRLNASSVHSSEGNPEHTDTAKGMTNSEHPPSQNRTLSECIDDEDDRRRRVDSDANLKIGGLGNPEVDTSDPISDAVKRRLSAEMGASSIMKQQQSNKDVPSRIKPGGAIEALAVAMQHGLEKAGPWLRRWPENEEREIPLVVSHIQEHAAVTLGQTTVIQLPEPERRRVIAGMRETKSSAVFLGFVEEENAPDGGSKENANFTMVGFAAVAEPTDIHLLDKTGEMGLKLVGRVKIQQITSHSAGSIRVKAVPWWDERQRFSHPGAVKDIIAAIHALYERATNLELTYRKLQGKYDQAHLVSVRPSLSDTVSEQLADISAPTEHEIAEILSFCALNFHVDARTRCWANSQRDTELRLGLARRSLETKIARLQADIKLVKEQREFQQLQAEGKPIGSPPEVTPFNSIPGAPAPPEIVCADIPRD